MQLITRISLVLVLFLCSCASLGRRADGLSVSLVNLRAQNATVWETTMLFTVRVENATPEPLTLAGAAHKIYVNGFYVGQGMTNERLDVPALGSATQTFTVHLANLRLASRIRPLIDSQRFEYGINSTLYQAPNNRRLKLSNNGVLDLHDFQPRRDGNRLSPVE